MVHHNLESCCQATDTYGATYPFVSVHSLAQRRRHEHERAAGTARAVVPTANAHSERQRRRREWEQLQRSALQTTDLDTGACIVAGHYQSLIIPNWSMLPTSWTFSFPLFRSNTTRETQSFSASTNPIVVRCLFLDLTSHLFNMITGAL